MSYLNLHGRRGPSRSYAGLARRHRSSVSRRASSGVHDLRRSSCTPPAATLAVSGWVAVVQPATDHHLAYLKSF